MQTLSKNNPQKRLLKSLNKTGGRGSTGRITIRHRGGGSRKLYRIINFGQENFEEKGIVAGFEYDPNRNAHIALVDYKGVKAYVLAPQNLNIGDEIITGDKVELNPGNRMKIGNMPIGTQVYNIELEPGKGGIMARGAGATAVVLAQEGGYTNIQLPSSEIRKVPEKCFASVGMVSNPEHRYKRIKNAGRRRLMGWRPKVRGVAMNPVDHPHGGGEGRSSIGMKHPKTPWGKTALGVKTRKKKWTSKLILQRRKKKKRKK